jgi:diguanylate cyclase (GGDEF)-like protein/PAS domain S-box-containing protein
VYLSPTDSEAVDDVQERVGRALARDTMNVVLFLDVDSTIRFANAAARTLLGWEPDELIGRSGLDLVHPDDLAQVAAVEAYERAHPGVRELRKISLYVRVLTRSGRYRYMEPAGSNLLDVPDVAGFFLVLADATSRHQLDHVYELLAAGAPLREVATAIVALVELEHWAVEAVTLSDQSGPLAAVGGDVGGREPTSRLEVRAPADGVVGTLEIWLRPGVEPSAFERQGLERAAAIAGLAIERARTEATLRRAARTDPLTGLANRTAFADALDAMAAPESAAIVLVDLDGFKDVNDALGHACGDAVLTAAAERLLAAVAEPGLVCRLGGDEFAVLLTQVSGRDDAERVARAVLAALRAPIVVAESTVTLGACVGVCTPVPAVDRDRALQHADQALYRAKRLGRDRVVVAPPLP